jgi:hypothetical protein
MITDTNAIQNNVGEFCPAERIGVCEFCNVMTNDWIVFDGATGTCKCRRCYYVIVYPKPEGLKKLAENDITKTEASHREGFE